MKEMLTTKQIFIPTERKNNTLHHELHANITLPLNTYSQNSTLRKIFLA